MPRACVILPLYNKARWIGRAVDSILAQTFSDFELVVVNDGSTDQSPDIVAAYDDPRVRLIHQANAGPGAARNRGVAESSAPLVAFLDGDDEWMPEFLAESVRILDQNPDCSLVASAYYQGADQRDMTHRLRSYGVEQGPWRPPPDMPPAAFKRALDFLNSWAICCRRESWTRYGGFYDRNRCTYGEDTYLWLQLMLNEPIYRHLKPLVWFHTEASELGFGRGTVQPPRPILTDPEPVRASCPAKMLPLLERVLAYYALHAARRHARAGDLRTAMRMLRQFPVSRSLGRESVRGLAYIAALAVFGPAVRLNIVERWLSGYRKRHGQAAGQ